MQGRGWIGIAGALCLVAALGGCGGGGDGGSAGAALKRGAADDAPGLAVQAQEANGTAPSKREAADSKELAEGAQRPLVRSPFSRALSFELMAPAAGKQLLRLDLDGLRYELFDDIGGSISGSLTAIADEPGSFALSTNGRAPVSADAVRLRVRDGVVVGAFPFAQTVAGATTYPIQPFVGMATWQAEPGRIDGTYNRFDLTRGPRMNEQGRFAQARISGAGTVLEQCVGAAPVALATCPAGALQRYTLAREGSDWRATNVANAADQQRFRIGMAGSQPVWLASAGTADGTWTLQVGLPAVAGSTRVRAIGPVTSGPRWGFSVGGDGFWFGSWRTQPGVALGEQPVPGVVGLGLASGGPYTLRSERLVLSLLPVSDPAQRAELSLGLVEVSAPQPGGDGAIVTYEYKLGERPTGLVDDRLNRAVDAAASLAEMATPAFAGYLPIDFQMPTAFPADLYAIYRRKSTANAYDARWVQETQGSDSVYYAQAAQGFDRAWRANYQVVGNVFVFDTLFARPAGSARRFVHTTAPLSAADGIGVWIDTLNGLGAQGYCSSAGPLATVLGAFPLRKEAAATSRCEFVALDLPSSWVQMLAQLNAQGAQGFLPFLTLNSGGPRQIYVRDQTQAGVFGFYEVESGLAGLNVSQQNARRLELWNREGALGATQYPLAQISYADRLPSRMLFMLARGCSGALCP